MLTYKATIVKDLKQLGIWHDDWNVWTKCKTNWNSMMVSMTQRYDEEQSESHELKRIERKEEMKHRVPSPRDSRCVDCGQYFTKKGLPIHQRKSECQRRVKSHEASLICGTKVIKSNGKLMSRCDVVCPTCGLKFTKKGIARHCKIHGSSLNSKRLYQRSLQCKVNVMKLRKVCNVFDDVVSDEVFCERCGRRFKRRGLAIHMYYCRDL